MTSEMNAFGIETFYYLNSWLLEFYLMVFDEIEQMSLVEDRATVRLITSSFLINHVIV